MDPPTEVPATFFCHPAAPSTRLNPVFHKLTFIQRLPRGYSLNFSEVSFRMSLR